MCIDLADTYRRFCGFPLRDFIPGHVDVCIAEQNVIPGSGKVMSEESRGRLFFL